MKKDLRSNHRLTIPRDRSISRIFLNFLIGSWEDFQPRAVYWRKIQNESDVTFLCQDGGRVIIREEAREKKEHTFR